MNRELLENMTKEELIYLVEIQARAIESLDMQRCDSNVIIDHLVSAIGSLNLLHDNNLKRDHDQEYLNDYVYQMYQKYPSYLVKTETAVDIPQDEQPS